MEVSTLSSVIQLLLLAMLALVQLQIALASRRFRRLEAKWLEMTQIGQSLLANGAVRPEVRVQPGTRSGHTHLPANGPVMAAKRNLAPEQEGKK